jgi:exodeoxyribonuclease VII small subunit
MKFEDSLAKLEDLVRNMESGEMKLDEMIKAFDEGRKLADDCQKELESIRLRIEKVTAGGVEQVAVKPDGDVAL